MASHGVPRSSTVQQQTPEARRKELETINDYRHLVDEVTRKVGEKDFSPELLQQTAALLNQNPEYYTMWNIRRRIYAAEFTNLAHSVADGTITQQSRDSQVLQIIQLDLQFLFPLLLKFPKCYWIWNHRIWLLQQSSLNLPVDQARKIWEDELALVGKMLSRDNRNYHGWGYRRFVVGNLESSQLKGDSMSRKEFEYTTKMIGNNLSNFSAWHNRTNVIIRMLAEEEATSSERREVLDSELKLIHEALFDPYDQSLWFYHQNLLCSFDPSWRDRTLVPDLSTQECLEYIVRECDFIKEVLEDAEDCKWAYQALVECAVIESKLRGGLTKEKTEEIGSWIKILKNLDPLRNGRWSQLEGELL